MLLGNRSWVLLIEIEFELASLAGAIHAVQDDHRKLLHSGLQAAYITALELDPGYAMLERPGQFPLEGPHPMMLHDFINLEKQLLTLYYEFLARSDGISGSCGGSP